MASKSSLWKCPICHICFFRDAAVIKAHQETHPNNQKAFSSNGIVGREQVIEAIAKYTIEKEGFTWDACQRRTKDNYIRVIKHSLEVAYPSGHPMIGILEDDQSLPEDAKIKLGYSPDIDKGQRSLIDSGWRKLLPVVNEPKEEK